MELSSYSRVDGLFSVSTLSDRKSISDPAASDKLVRHSIGIAVLTLSSSSSSCGSSCLRLLAPLSSAGKPSTDLGRPPRMARLPSSSSVPALPFRFTVWYAAGWPGRGGGGKWILSWGLWGELLAVASPGVELGEEDEVCACGAGTTSGFGSLNRN